MHSPSYRSLILIVAFVAAGTACTTGSSAGVTVSDAWARPASGPDQPAAAYLLITNTSGQADALVAVSSPAAQSIEMHETSMDASGMMGMQPIARIDVGPGTTVTLEPGGMHLMINGLIRQLQAGDRVELDLVFEHAGKIMVQADVRGS